MREGLSIPLDPLLRSEPRSLLFMHQFAWHPERADMAQLYLRSPISRAATTDAENDSLG